MKVKCVDNDSGVLWLTIGKEYEVSNADTYNYRVKCDTGQTYWYRKECFELVLENHPIELQEKSTIQSLITELNALHKELEVCVIIHDWGYFINSWFGEFKVETEQDVLEALNEMLKLVSKYKGENDDNG